MFIYLRQLWKSTDLRKKIIFTLLMLLVYRFMAHISIPGTDPDQLSAFLNNRDGAGAIGIFAALTGGAVDNFSIALLGLSPYINASIIMQLMTVIIPKFEELNKEGEAGRRTMTKWTRWITVPLAFVQSYGFLLLLGSGGINLLDLSFPGVLLPMLYVTAASMAIMWIGELITEHGIGNGISLIIFAGIIASMPSVIGSMLLAGSGRAGAIFLFILVNIATLVAVVLFTDAHRLIPITYANQGAGRGVQGSLPIRLLQAGMIPIIFAISLVAFPSVLSQILTSAPRFAGVKQFIDTYLNTQNPSILYMIVYFLLVVGFTYFYVSVTFKPGDIAENIQKRGGFIPGVRPGKATEAQIAKISSRLNLWGGGFLGLVAIIPLFFTKWGGLSSQDVIISGAGIIIIVGVVMELIRQMNAQLLAHDYEKLV